MDPIGSGPSSIIPITNLTDGRAPTGTLVAAAEAGDGAAVAALERIGRYLGVGIASLVNLLEPELIVVGGGFAAAGALLLDPARRVLARDGLTPGRDTVRIVLAELGPDAGLVGAALVGREALAAAAG